MNRDNKPWFAPKRYGIGTGLPIAWQGWALMIAYIFIVSVTAPFAMLIPYFLYHNWWNANAAVYRRDVDRDRGVHGHMRQENAGRLALALG